MATRVAPLFDTKSAAQVYFDRHAAECAELNCSASDVGAEIAINQIFTPLVVLLVALALHRLGFWQASYGRLSRWLRRSVLASAAFGAMVMALFVAMLLPFKYYIEVWLGKTSGSIITIVSDDPRFAPPTFLQRNFSFFWDQFELALMLGLVGAIIAPLAFWLFRTRPRTLFAIAGALYLSWVLVPTIDPWAETFPLAEGKLRDDVEQIADRADIDMGRIRTGNKNRLGLGQNEARAEWHDGGTKAIMNEAMLNIMQINPKAYSPPFKPFTAKEFRAVVGHELAHLKQYHWQWLIGFRAILASFLTALAAWIALRLSSRPFLTGPQGQRHAPTVLALFAATGFAFHFVALPLFNNAIRWQENSADQVALDLARDPDGAAELAYRLARGGPLEHRRWYNTLYRSHPDARTRIERAMRWKANNEPAKYTATGWSGPVRNRWMDDLDPIDGWSEHSE
ncbi:M48 family metalloprotease [Erythrobacter crassostreae]|uniref:M48 family metalloprotease n=1 Tax=Erythrobacter crassostreae TaxID=2828328 RepID=A0A9X1F2P6_9SPHN|nr:M48 family metalloprotease [Erythrobacter crassostrea]